jgi:hypothetical protein
LGPDFRKGLEQGRHIVSLEKPARLRWDFPGPGIGRPQGIFRLIGLQESAIDQLFENRSPRLRSFQGQAFLGLELQGIGKVRSQVPVEFRGRDGTVAGLDRVGEAGIPVPADARSIEEFLPLLLPQSRDFPGLCLGSCGLLAESGFIGQRRILGRGEGRTRVSE